MAHAIEFVNGAASMFYAGEVPWHGLGTRIAEPVPSAEAIQLAGLDWEVETVPAFGDDVLAERHVAIRRSSDHTVFGFASKRYVPIQNREAFEACDALVADGLLRWETAMSLKGGSRVAAVARFEEDWRILGDQHFTYLALVLDHAAGGAVNIFPTTVRVVCNNTAEAALGEGGARGVRIVHYGDVADKFARAQELLRVTTAQQQRYAEWLTHLGETEVKGEQVRETAADLFGSLDEQPSTQRQHALDRFLDMYRAEAVEGQGPTGYSLFQTVTAWGNYGVRAKSQETRFASVLDGPGADFIRRGAAVVERITGVARVEPELVSA